MPVDTNSDRKGWKALSYCAAGNNNAAPITTTGTVGEDRSPACKITF